MTEPTTPRPRFDRQAFAVLQQGAIQAMGEVPELKAVGIVCVWDFPDQVDLPSATLVMPDQQPPGADTVFRMLLATTRFQQVLLDGAIQKVAHLHGQAVTLSKVLTHAKSQGGTGAVAESQGQPAQGHQAADAPMDEP